MLRKTNGPQQEQEGFDFHVVFLYPDDDDGNHHEAEKVDLNRRVSILSKVSNLKAVAAINGGGGDDNVFVRVKWSNWKAANETKTHPQNVVKPAPEVAVFFEKGFFINRE